MRGGAKFLCFAACLATAGCAAEGELTIRPIADPSAKLRPGADRLADARAQLALGNVGLATEAFRKVVREQPDNVDAYAGLAACYEAMGRYDIARQNYEAALALAPRSPALLDALAVTLDKQGLREEAAQVRAEIADLAAASAALEAEVQPEPAPVAVASTPTSETVRLPPAAPASVVTVPLPVAKPTALTAIAAAPQVQPASSITVQLPPARPVAAGPAVSLPAPNLAAEARVDVRTVAEPRLERLSLGEVALLTANEPRWRPQVVARTARSTTVRWVPLRTASSTRPNIRLLNAARSQGLAARTRNVLLGRGWRLIDIGDATEVRATSLVIYPASRQTLGRSLAAQFGFRSAITGKNDQLVVLLGRDAAGMRAVRARG
jgi:tetratricopeptide (TPR) repeat protein